MTFKIVGKFTIGKFKPLRIGDYFAGMGAIELCDGQRLIGIDFYPVIQTTTGIAGDGDAVFIGFEGVRRGTLFTAVVLMAVATSMPSMTWPKTA